MPLSIQPAKPKGRQTVSHGFSISPEQRKRVERLADHYNTNMSQVVAQLIDQAFVETFPTKKRK